MVGTLALCPLYDVSLTRVSNARPATKNTTSSAIPAFWLAVTAVITPIKSGPMNDVTFPVSANNPKYCAMRSFGARRIRSVRDAACKRPAGGADQAAEHEIGALGRAREQRATRHRRRDLDEQNRVLVDQQNCAQREQKDQQTAGNDALGPQPVIELAA